MLLTFLLAGECKQDAMVLRTNGNNNYVLIMKNINFKPTHFHILTPIRTLAFMNEKRINCV